jgi:hypothetical protein
MNWLRQTVLISTFPLVVVGCGAAKNPISNGSPIPGTSITSCGDDLLEANQANPSGTADVSLSVATSQTLVAGTIAWQADCPAEIESSDMTQFTVGSIAIYKDDAGFPGDQIGTTSVSLTSSVSCANRSIVQIPGVTQTQTLAATPISDLTSLCAQYKAAPTAAPLFVQVEFSGQATSCSNQTTSLLLRSQASVSCP